MINFEKYGEEALDDLCHFVSNFNINACSNDCNDCIKKAKEWLLKEYKNKTDWSKVPIDTPILVWDNPEYKCKRHFAGIKYNEITTYSDGGTSWTSKDDLEYWAFAELVEE